MTSLRPFFPNQSAAAEQVFEIFAAQQSHYVLLRADVQMGKTGTYQAVIRRMLESHLVERVLLLCGSHETTLRSQAQDDTALYNPTWTDRIRILFRQDLRKARAEISNMDRTLIVVDESHMDQGQGQELSQFLAHYDLALDGTRVGMVALGTYILSVDATPYSEISALHTGSEARAKRVVTLEAGVGYFGPADYYKHQLLKPTFPITSPEFEELLCAQVRRWVLIRLTAPRRRRLLPTDSDVAVTPHQHLADLARKHGFAIREFTSRKSEVEMEALAEAPPVTTIIILHNRLRAGKVVPKAHVGFVWEDAATSKTDVVIQGLLGRMCGYRFGAEKPAIYLPPALLEKVAGGPSEVERHMNPALVPLRATNIVAPPHRGSSSKDGRHACPPLVLHVCPEVLKQHKSRKALLGLCLKSLRAEIDALLAASTALSVAQKDEILECLPTLAHEEIALREFTAGKSASFTRYFEALCDATERNEPPTEHVSNRKFLTFAVTHADFAHPRAAAGRVYVLAYTEAEPSKVAGAGAGAAAAESEIPNTTGTTIFNRQDAVRPCEVQLPVAATESPVAFELALSGAIVGNAGVQTKGTRLIRCDMVFDRARFNHRSGRENDVEAITKRLCEDHGVKGRVCYKAGRPGRHTFVVDTIIISS